jgi:hypothetical protein
MKTMKNTFSILFSPEAIAAMAANCLAPYPEATPNDLLHGVCFLSQPLKLTGAEATLDTQMGPWISLVKVARQWGWDGPNTPAAAAALRHLTPSDARGLAASVRRACSAAQCVPKEVAIALNGFLAICDGGEIQIEHA